MIAESIEIVESTRQIIVGGIPVEGLLGTLAFLVAVASLFIAIKATRESARANTLSYLPVLTLEYDHTGDKVVIKNIGKGTAVNIVLDKYYNWSADKNFKIYGLSTLVFETVNMLDPDRSVKVAKKVKGLPDSLGLLTWTIFSKHTKNIDFIIKFRDVSGKKYLTVINICKGKIRIRNFPRAVGLRTFLTLTYHKTAQAILSVIYLALVNYRKITDNRDKGKKNK